MTPGEIRRLYFIVRTFLSYGLDELIPRMRITLPLRIWRRTLFWMPNRHKDQVLGERLRLALQELGPVWIKFGQMLSTRRDLFPPQIADELAMLQDRVAPFDGVRAKKQIEEAMGNIPVETWFDDFDIQPLASASIAQVHTARLKPLVTAGIENVLNAFLYRAPALKAARQRLNGKVLRIVLKEFSTPLVLVFSERQLDVLGEWEGEADCSVITHMSVLPKLRDRQQLTALIRSGELEVEGDIQVVQNFVALSDLAEFDPAELLAPFIGDIAAEGIGKAIHGGTAFLRKNLQRQQRYAAEVITEEWRMAPGPLEVAWFAEETAAVERAVDALTKRLEKLEGK